MDREVTFMCVTKYGDNAKITKKFPKETSDEVIHNEALEMAYLVACQFIDTAEELFDDIYGDTKFDSEDEYLDIHKDFIDRYYNGSRCAWIEETIVEEETNDEYEKCEFCMY